MRAIMQGRLRQIFHVLPDESAKVLSFALLAALLQAGVAIGFATADSLFLSHLGIARLPLVYIFMPVVMAVYAPLYSVLLAKFGSDRLFKLTLAGLVMGGVFFGVGTSLVGEDRMWLLFAMKFYVGLWFIALYTLFWNFTDDYFSILDGKRLYGLIAAGGSTGGMLGSALVIGLAHLLPPAQLFLAWAVLALLTFPVLVSVLRRFKKIDTEEMADDGLASPVQLVPAVIRTIRSSRFALALALVCFCAVALSGMLEYLSLGVFSAGKTTVQLTELLGTLQALANALTLVINLFFFSRLVGRLGINNTALILPLGYLCAFVFFYLHDGFTAALLAFYCYQSLMSGVEYNNINLLFNALPGKIKRQLRTFIEAMCEPVATASAGIFLFYWAGRLGNENVALSGMIAACGAVMVALFIRHDYVLALARNLRSDWLNFADSEKNWGHLVAEADRVLLREKAFHGNRPQQLMAVDLLWRVQDAEARAALLQLVSTASPAEADSLRPVIAGMLHSEDTATLAEILLWLESDRSPADPEVLDEFTAAGALPVSHLQDWRNSRHPSHVATTAVARWRSSRLDDTCGALGEIQQLLAGDAVSRRWAIRAIGDCRHSRYAQDLLRFMQDPDPEIRIETLRTLRKLASPDTTVLLQTVIPLVATVSPAERALILEIAGKIGDTAAIAGLLLAAEHFSSAESRQLEMIVAGMGLKTIPTVIHLLRNTSAPLHSRSVAARALSRLAMPQLLLMADDIIATELRRAQDYVIAWRSLAGESGSRSDGLIVLTRFYHDAAAEGLEFALELLSLTGQLPDFDLIRASLTFANPKDRANAIETIQQSCPHSLFQQIRPLIEATVQVDGMEPHSHFAPLPVETILRQATVSNFPLESSAAFIAWHELGFPGGLALLRSRLDQTEAGRSLESLVALLARFSPGANADAPRAPHPVERVAALVRAPLFQDARVLALDYLAGRSEEKVWPAGTVIYEAGVPPETLFVVVEGQVALARPGRSWIVNKGGTFGERVLMGDTERRERAVSDGSRALALPGAAVARAIEIFPALGISLYKFKTISAVE
ncbi:MAG TPA: HEAT repeat domain-containing protein [Opitutaceae bacterium]|nr:HEAT repeat domain-containing protein [Opitutaceae bacterium]